MTFFLVRWYDEYIRLMGRFVAFLSRCSGKFGALCTRWPWTVLLLSLLAGGLCCIGWLRFRMESDGDQLWVPQNSKAMKDRDWVESRFVTSGGYARYLAVPKPSLPQLNNNAIQLEVAWELFHIHEDIMALTFGRNYTFKDICERSALGSCKQFGFFNFWNMSFETYKQDVGASDTDPSQGNYSALLQAVNSRTYPDGGSVSTLSIFGNIVIGNDTNLPLVAAEAIAITYSIDQSADDDYVSDWYEAYIDYMKEATDKAQFIDLGFIAGSSVDDEIDRSVTGNIYLIIIAFVIFLVIAIFVLSKLSWVRSRTSLALCGLIIASLAIMGGYGLAMAIGQPFTILQQTLPYILLGVGVDVIFVLVKAMDEIHEQHPTLDLQDKFRLLMSEAGLHVVVSTLASVVAFALGSISELPSITWFSVYATLGVFVISVLLYTGFVATLFLTEKRIAAGRRDFCCCWTGDAATGATDCPATSALSGPAAPVKGFPSASTGSALSAADQILVTPPGGAMMAARPSGNHSSYSDSDMEVAVKPPADHLTTSTSSSPKPPPKRDYVGVFMDRWFAPLLLSWPGRIFVLCAFSAFCIVSGIGTTKLGEGQPLSQVAPDDSYLQDYIRINENTFEEQLGPETDIYFRNIDWAQPSVQADMTASLATTLNNPYVNGTLSAFLGNWLIDLIVWVNETYPTTQFTADGCTNPFVPIIDQARTEGESLSFLIDPQPLPGCIPQASFYSLLNIYLQRHPTAADDMSFALGTNGSVVLEATRMPLLQISSKDNDKYDRLALEAVRDTEGLINGQVMAAEAAAAGFDVFLMYTDDYVFAEGDAVLREMTLEYCLTAVAGVGVVMLFMLVSPLPCIIMMVAVGMVDLFLFGEMWIFGIRFNQVSVVNLVMATGLAVDYSVYISQKIMSTSGTRKERVHIALVETGSAILQGGTTALLGTIPLAFASSAILRTFFALLFGTIVFSMLVGLLFVPVVFSLIAPATIPGFSHSEGGDSKEAAGEVGEGKAGGKSGQMGSAVQLTGPAAV